VAVPSCLAYLHTFAGATAVLCLWIVALELGDCTPSWRRGWPVTQGQQRGRRAIQRSPTLHNDVLPTPTHAGVTVYSLLSATARVAHGRPLSPLNEHLMHSPLPLQMGVSSGHWALSVHLHVPAVHCWVKTRPPSTDWVLEWQAFLQAPPAVGEWRDKQGHLRVPARSWMALCAHPACARFPAPLTGLHKLRPPNPACPASQFSASVCKSLQTPEQQVCPEGHSQFVPQVSPLLLRSHTLCSATSSKREACQQHEWLPASVARPPPCARQHLRLDTAAL